MMKKLFLGLVGISCSLAITVQPAFANPTISTDETAPYVAQVSIVDQAGEHTFQVSTPGLTLSEFLLQKGLTLTEYRYGDNKELDGKNILEKDEKTKIYKISSTGESLLVDLPAPVQEEKTSNLFLGETEVKAEGKGGKLLKTTVTTGLRGSDVKTTEETLLVLEAPTPKVVLVGTKERVSAPTQGVNAPWASTDKKTLDGIRNGVSDNRLVNVLTAQVGKAYVWGDEGPDSFDCSGLVYYVLNASGVNVPRLTATDYGARATPVALKDIQPGDIFWNSGHIAMYAGNGKVIHAANPRVGVIITDLGYFTSGNYQLGRLF